MPGKGEGLGPGSPTWPDGQAGRVPPGPGCQFDGMPGSGRYGCCAVAAQCPRHTATTADSKPTLAFIACSFEAISVVPVWSILRGMITVVRVLLILPPDTPDTVKHAPNSCGKGEHHKDVSSNI